MVAGDRPARGVAHGPAAARAPRRGRRRPSPRPSRSSATAPTCGTVARAGRRRPSAAAAATAGLARGRHPARPTPPLGFVHPLVRDAVYRDLAPAERELRHARAAHAAGRGGAPDERRGGAAPARAARGDGRVVRGAARGRAHSAVRPRRGGQRGRLPAAGARGAARRRTLRAYVLLELACLEERTGRHRGARAPDRGLRGSPIPTRRARAGLRDRVPSPCSPARPTRRRAVLRGDRGAARGGATTGLPARGPGSTVTVVLRRSRLPLELALRPSWRDPPRPTAGQALMTAYAAFDWAHRCGPADECAAIVFEGRRWASITPATRAPAPVAIGVGAHARRARGGRRHWDAMLAEAPRAARSSARSASTSGAAGRCCMDAASSTRPRPSCSRRARAEAVGRDAPRGLGHPAP